MTVLVLDLDGVVVRGHPEGGRWDKNLERDLGIDTALVQEKFFQPHFRKIAIGEADLFETLDRVWPELGCKVSARDFVDYWFAMDSLPQGLSRDHPGAPSGAAHLEHPWPSVRRHLLFGRSGRPQT